METVIVTYEIVRLDDEPEDKVETMKIFHFDLTNKPVQEIPGRTFPIENIKEV